MPFSEKLKRLRKEKRWSQLDLAQSIDSDARQISRYEKGRITPSTDVVLRMAEVFDVSVDYLLREDALRRPLKIHDQEIVQRLHDLHHLNSEDKNALLHILDAMIAKNKIEAVLGSAHSKGPAMKVVG